MGAKVQSSSTPRPRTSHGGGGSTQLKKTMRIVEMKCNRTFRTCRDTSLRVPAREEGCDNCEAECSVARNMPGVGDSFISKLATQLKYCLRGRSRKRKFAACEEEWKECANKPTKVVCASCEQVCRSALDRCPARIPALNTYEKKRAYCSTKSDFFDIDIQKGVDEINRPWPQKQDLKEQHEWESKYCASIAPSDPSTVTPSPTISVTATPTISPGVPLVGNEFYPLTAAQYCPGQASGY